MIHVIFLSNFKLKLIYETKLKIKTIKFNLKDRKSINHLEYDINLCIMPKYFTFD